MSSPIHSYLFSPPPSPPSRSSDLSKTGNPNDGFTSLKTLLIPTELIPRSPLLGSDSHSSSYSGNLKIRSSPRTPQQSKFTLDSTTVFPSSSRSKSKSRVFDPESTPTISSYSSYSSPTTPKRPTKLSENIKVELFESPNYIPTNVPSKPLPPTSISLSIPKPLIRLLFLISLIFSSILLLIFVPSSRLPSLKAASLSRRLALDSNGKAFITITDISSNSINSFQDAKDQDYKPPQIKAAHMMKRSSMVKLEKKGPPAPHPRTTRPALTPRPLPRSHELLAIQSYLLSSAYNVIPEHVNPNEPIDANTVLGFGSHKLGENGSQLEQDWLDELADERQDDVVIWYGGNGRPNPPHEIIDFLSTIHKSNKKPTLISCVSQRKDRGILLSILDRLELPLREYPIILIGNKPIIGNLEVLEELGLSGELKEMFNNIGWSNKKEMTQTEWKPKYAKVQKKSMSEVEEAIQNAQIEQQLKFEQELEDDIL
ncbi:uncharacterized protein L201_005210 [Kwoniella dendrophila CBS 6074]|uniref:Uncharacterized protein n=1 Tax=Kwoniella dendrophila CBS 6074 TaxID=1295534 RepID=A0AAX4JYE4_9TREE